MLGRRIPIDELGGPATSCRVIENWTLTTGVDGERVVREASLRRTYSKGEPPLPDSLQEAQVTRADERGLLIVGL